MNTRISRPTCWLRKALKSRSKRIRQRCRRGQIMNCQKAVTMMMIRRKRLLRKSWCYRIWPRYFATSDYQLKSMKERRRNGRLRALVTLKSPKTRTVDTATNINIGQIRRRKMARKKSQSRHSKLFALHYQILSLLQLLSPSQRVMHPSPLVRHLQKAAEGEEERKKQHSSKRNRRRSCPSRSPRANLMTLSAPTSSKKKPRQETQSKRL